MTGALRIANARVVTPDTVLVGGLVAEDGLIQEVVPHAALVTETIDFDGDFLLPGLVELHTDNLERQFQPRPKVRWPATAALLAHDRQMVAAGITTVCDAVCVGFYGGKRERAEFLETSLEGLRAARRAGVLKADHHLHLRCEIADPAVVELFEPLVGEPTLKVVSLMDHTPGQRQWHDLDRYRTFHRGRTDASESEFEALIERRVIDQRRYAEQHRQALIALLDGRKVARASHDDTTIGHVEQAAAEGISIAEFPTTFAAAEAAHAHGLQVIMGAPNLILGGSHSGNVSARALAEAGLLDALSSDYVPLSLLHGAFRLATLLGQPLAEVMALVTSRPAAMIGLDDRGRIEAGLTADLIRVRMLADTPAVVAVWRRGERVA
jgi:alpha-D-ribose 1-methylphosphonate 5-triphosphate diphosphatase